MSNLAVLYDHQGKYNETQTLLTQALEIVQPVLGSEHPITVTVRENLENLRRTSNSKNE